MQDRVQGAARTAIGLLPGLLVIVLFIAPALSVISTQRSAAQAALEYVRDHLEPGDQIATRLPALAYLVIGRCDHFVALDNPFLWETDDGPVDPHLGLPWIGTGDELRQIAAKAPRLWLVVEERYADPYAEELGEQSTVPFREQDYVIFLVEGLPHQVMASP
jgi:hypothetical protein